MSSPQAAPRFHLDKRAGKLAAEVTAAGCDDDLLSTREAAELLGVSEQWLEVARCRGIGPKFIRLSTRRLRYSRRALMEFLREREHVSTAEYRTTGGRKPGSRVVAGKVVAPEGIDAVA